MAIWSGNMYIQAKSYYDFLEKMYPNKPRICAQALEPFYYMEDTNGNVIEWLYWEPALREW